MRLGKPDCSAARLYAPLTTECRSVRSKPVERSQANFAAADLQARTCVAREHRRFSVLLRSGETFSDPGAFSLWDKNTASDQNLEALS